MRRQSSQNYVCWRCLCLRPAERALRRVRPSATAVASSTLSTSWPFRAVANRQPLRSVSTVAGSAPDSTWAWPSAPKELRSSSQESSIRERLRQWEAENPAPALLLAGDNPSDGSVVNAITRTLSAFNFQPHSSAQDEDASQPHFDGVDMVDLGLTGSVLQAGDLVEVSSGSRGLRLLAICLGNFNGHLHFYTNTGKWFTSRDLRSGFVVKNFATDPAELKAVIDAIPSLSSSSVVLDELQDLNVGPSRDLGASLIRKMYTFQSAARLIHQTYVERLSRAHTSLGHDERLMTLREIADALLPASLKRNKGAFPPEALYAVYSAIEQDDIAFRVLDRGARHHESYHFFVQSAEVQANVRHVEQLVRDFCDESLGGRSRKTARVDASNAAEFKSFLLQAREVIDQSRQHRDWSPHGMIGPSRLRSSEPWTPMSITWSETGLAVIKFMQHWAASGGFRSGSQSHWIGASILRAVNRYKDALLDSATAWTFLQEIGWIPPWDVSARHSLRLPGLQLDRHLGLLQRPAEAEPATIPPDRLAHLRQDFARNTVYCIDSADTLDVDDGISLEPLRNGEYWIHVHVADPASRISPRSAWAEQAALRAQTSYLAGFHQPMFDHDGVREAFSLGPNRPTLTFSARVTEAGNLVDYQVTPGTLRDVVYITPEEVYSICGDDADSLPASPSEVLEVGAPPAADTPLRRMTTAGELSRKQRSEIKTLSRLAKALHNVRIQNGAMPTYLPRPSAKVSLDNIAPLAAGGGLVHYRGDPYIRVAYEGAVGDGLVNSLMQLAGEVAARWCYERDIPIPYRVQLLAGRNYNAWHAFTRDVLYPKLAAGKKPSLEDYHTLRALVGGYDMSATPGPNLAMGLDLYTKVTSPLRRYPDLLVHWQVEAALLEEHRRGKSLVVRKSPGRLGSSASSEEPRPPARGKAQEHTAFLPFSKQDLEESVLPRLRLRERHGKLLDNVDGNSQWILQALVRAWHFGDSSTPLPRTFRFTVSDVEVRRYVKGRLDWFDRPATVELEDMNNVIRMAEVKVGDVFRVELARVNVHMNKIYVRLLEKIDDNKENE
ncbi:hypothetical protein VTK56DRAFT_7857 [Thermocarpiscus australiensis]